MHIPDGYLSPETCAAAVVVAAPALVASVRRIRSSLGTRQVPLLAMFSAVTSLVMMLNVPVPGGTTAHVMGSVMIAIALGPAAATVAVSVSLLFQALLFADGGVLSLGANIVNMAVLAPWAGWAVYRFVVGLAPARRAVAGFVAGYVGINVAALGTAIMLGVQPILFHAADGTPLYSPYPLAVTLPVMVAAHGLVVGPLEGAVTVAALSALQRWGMLPDVGADRPTRVRPAVIGGILGALVLLAPLGLLATGTAFAEEAPEELDLGAFGLRSIPAGMARWADAWRHAPFPDYTVAGLSPTVGYVISAVLGAGLLVAVVFLLVRRFPRPERI